MHSKTMPPAIQRLTRCLLIPLCVSLAVGAAAVTAVAAEAHQPPPKVLVINAYHPGEDWSDNELAGIFSTFKQANSFWVPAVEHLDAKRFPAPDHLTVVRNYLKAKYANQAFDLIMTLDNPAFDLMLNYRQELFAGTPMVFAGLNGYRPELLAGQAAVTGVAEAQDIAGTLNLALAIHPQSRVVLVIHDDTSSGRALRQEMERLESTLGQGIEVRYPVQGPVAGLVAQLKALPPDSLVLLLTYVTDGSGRTFTRAESTGIIADASPVPVYAMHETRLGHGIVGGLLLEGQQHGAQAARLALRVLAGENPAAIPVVASMSRPVFDYKQLKRFKIDLDQLPPGAVIHNRPTPFFQRHPEALPPSIGAFFLLLATSLVLIVAIGRVKKAKNEVLQSQERLRQHHLILAAVLEHTHMMAVYLDTRFNFVWVNLAYAQTCKQDPAFFPGKNHFELYPNPENQAIFQQVVDSGVPYFAEARAFEFPDQPGRGVTYWDWSLIPIHDSAGAIVGLVFTLSEVTRRIVMQTELIHANQSLQRYKHMVDSSPNLVAAVSRDYRYIFVNQAFLDYHQTRQSEVVGRPVEALLGQAVFERSLKPQLERCFMGESLRFEMSSEYPLLGQRHLLVSYFPLKDETGAVASVAAIINDLTELKQMKTEQEKLQQQLNQMQKLEAIGALAGGIAHDFNNILFPIVGFAELIQDDLPADSPLRSPVQEILKGTCRARDLVRQILTFSRQTDHEIKVIRPHLVVQEVLRLIKATLPKNIEIHEEIQSDGAMVLADPTQIHQIVMNLITNAYHAMEEKGGTLTVALTDVFKEKDDGVALAVPGPYVRLCVSDTGCGMDPKVQAKIFDPYFTTKSKDKGTGLGLAVVHGIVKSYHGEIVVKSAVGQGTTFDIFLPAAQSVQPESATLAATAVPKGKERILLVDDEDQIARLARMMLERLGYQVHAFTSSSGALEAFGADPQAYHLVITDISMPEMTGDQLARAILKLRPSMPIIMCTGFSERITDEKAKAMGAKGFLMKPVVKSELATLVRKVLDGK